MFPSLKADWILHPDDSIQGTMRFRRQFATNRVPDKCQLKIRAMRQFKVSVNQTLVGNSPEDHNWKSAIKFDIAPHLKIGENVITVDVTNLAGPAALLVEATNVAIDLNSSQKWQVSRHKDRSLPENWSPPVVSLKGGAHLESQPGPIQKSKNYPIYMMLFGAYCLITLLAMSPFHIFVRTRKKIGSDNPPTKFQPSEKRLIDRIGSFIKKNHLLILIAVVMLVVNVHNTMNYKYDRACFDWLGHVSYIKQMASEWRVPVATDGWEMFQPPLYYFLSAIIYNIFGGELAEPNSLKAVQFLGMFCGIANAFFALHVLRKLFPRNKMIQAMGFSLVGLMPMCFYMNPLISNEIFAGATISLSIALLIKYGFAETIPLKHYLLMATSIGLALLSKYTALFVLITATIIFSIRMLGFTRSRRTRRSFAALEDDISQRSDYQHEFRRFLIFLTVVFIICGWLYVRNFMVFGDAFIGNWDEKSTYHYEQPHGYRTLGFYLRFGSVFFHRPERSQWASVWDGQYGSLWADSHDNFLRTDDARLNKMEMTIIYLAFLPTMAIVLGFLQSLRKILSSWRSDPDLALVLVSVLTIISVLSFTMEVPFFSTIKAFFLLSLLPAIAVFGGKGLYTMCQNLGRFRYIVYCDLIILYLLIVDLFWYRGT